jgi:ATP-dependent helicase HrpB
VIVDAGLVALATEGVSLLGWSPAALALRARLAMAHEWAADEGWPAVDDAALLERLDDWAPALLADRRPRRRADFGAIDASLVLTAVARTGVGGGAMRRLDAIAPPTIVLPGGRRATVDYGGGTPSISIRLQDLFGCRHTPRLGDRHAPVVVHVLSPAGRPVQVTADLAGFWAGSYAEVRKEMRGRYPKHPWPDDPGSAPPARRRARG